jgi:HK97 family phage major capsid protein
MKPSTWEIAALAKDGQRNYLLGAEITGYVQGQPTPRIWGLRVVLNANMPAQATNNKVALVGAFASAAMVIRRDQINARDHRLALDVLRREQADAPRRGGGRSGVFRPAGFATVTSAA